MLKGHIYEQPKNKKWVLKYYRTPQILAVLPVHPDDAKHLTKNDHIKEVNFQIETIAMGTSEFDIRDCDVARIINKPNLYSSIENAIIKYTFQKTQTAGELTRQIIKIIDEAK